MRTNPSVTNLKKDTTSYSHAKYSLCTLQGKGPLAEVIKKVFSVIKLTKIVQKTSAATSIFGNECFYGGSNGTSTHLKNMGIQRF